jgi:hypothetical protein
MEDKTTFLTLYEIQKDSEDVSAGISIFCHQIHFVMNLTSKSARSTLTLPVQLGFII